MTEGSEQPPRTSRASFWLTILTALTAAVTIVDHAPGLNVFVVSVLGATAVLTVSRARLDVWRWGSAALGIVLIAMFVFRAAEWLLFFNMMAALGVGAVVFAGSSSWIGMMAAALSIPARLHRGLSVAARPLWGRLHSLERSSSLRFLRGTTVGLVAVTVFGLLFASADQAFARLTTDVLAPDWDLSLLPARVIVALMTMAFIGSYQLVDAEGPVSRGRSIWTAANEPSAPRIRATDWAIPLALLNAVFGLFVFVQITVLFGGRTHVLETAGLTYAEYARSGFFQLVAVAILTLGVVALVIRLVPDDQARERRLMKGLLGLLCVFTLIVLVSALRRIGLYEETFGLTRLRLVVHASLLWLFCVFVALVAAGVLWKGSWLPRALVSLTVLGLLGFNLLNPDALIARRNIDRFQATGKLDVGYLASLSPDAAGEVMRLPADLRACVLDRLVGAAQPDPFWAFNLSRHTARSLAEGTPDEDCY